MCVDGEDGGHRACGEKRRERGVRRPCGSTVVTWHGQDDGPTCGGGGGGGRGGGGVGGVLIGQEQEQRDVHLPLTREELQNVQQLQRRKGRVSRGLGWVDNQVFVHHVCLRPLYGRGITLRRGE